MALSFLAAIPMAEGKKSKTPPAEEVEVAPLSLAGGRKLVYERSFFSERQVRIKQGFWSRVFDIVAGAPNFRRLVRPFDIATDSRGRIIVTDPGAAGVHIFDFGQQKYKFLVREGRDPLKSPQCVAVDSQDNIYVTDSETGKIFIFDANGKFKRIIGSIKGGEGYFKRPTGIAIDSEAKHIYVTDTARHQIFMLDLQGQVLQTIGRNGSNPGEFNLPTELALRGQQLIVVDAMNFRVQVLDRSGEFQYSIGRIGETSGTMFRPKGVDVDSENDIYVVDGLFSTVQVFDRLGRLLFYFGKNGDGPSEFQLPTGLFIDKTDRIYVVDSWNQRVQVFRFIGAARQGDRKGP